MSAEHDKERLHELESKAERLEHELEETLHEITEEIEEIKQDEPFSIKVNNKNVPVIGHHHTGLEIKGAAIAAGVRIQLDFVLSLEEANNRFVIIGDDQRIHVEQGNHFEAVPNDDHS